jgi:ribonuclease P protein component
VPPENPASCRLPASRRIKAGRDFARAKAEGRRVVQGCLIMNWVPARQASGSRVGVIVSRKVGPAVTRSRARRLLREAFRLHQHELNQPVDVVLIARPSIARLDRPRVEKDYLLALQRAGLRPPTASGI